MTPIKKAQSENVINDLNDCDGFRLIFDASGGITLQLAFSLCTFSECTSMCFQKKFIDADEAAKRLFSWYENDGLNDFEDCNELELNEHFKDVDICNLENAIEPILYKNWLEPSLEEISRGQYVVIKDLDDLDLKKSWVNINQFKRSLSKVFLNETKL